MTYATVFTLLWGGGVMIYANRNAQPRGKWTTAMVIGSWLIVCGVFMGARYL